MSDNRPQIYWFVLDGRAVTDIGRATVLDTYGNGRPTQKRLNRDGWAQSGNWLAQAVCRGEREYGPMELVEEIK